MIVRELLTAVGYKVDKTSEQQASKSFEKLKGMAQSLGLVLGAGAVYLGFKRMVGAASDVDETLNVVTTAFEDQADAVLKWAKDAGDASGRSQYAMRNYAATLGAVVGPTLGSAEATADLSTNMAQLAVDLGSFYNATDDEALQALRAGLIGSTEPLQRFGVAMNVAALEAFAASKGIRKKMKDMTEAEKIDLRYQFILARTTKAQGDAAKTSDSYANLVKRLEGNVYDLQVNIGRAFIPILSKLIKVLAAGVKAVGEFAYEHETELRFALEAVGNSLRWVSTLVIGLAEAFKESGLVIQSILTALTIRLLLIQAPFLLWYAVAGAAIGGIILLLDDLWKGFTTGEGVMAGFLNEFTAVANETDSYATATRKSLQNALDYWIEYFTGVKNGSWRMGEAIRGFFRSIGDWLYDWIGLPGDVLGEFATDVDTAIKGAIDSVIAYLPTGMQRLADFFTGVGESIKKTINTIIDWFDEKLKPIIDEIKGAVEFVGTKFGGFGRFVGEIATDIGDLVGIGPKPAEPMIGPATIAPPGIAAPAGSREVNANQSIEININAPGADGSAIAAAVAPAVGRAADEGNRRIAQQLLLGGTS